MDVRIEPSWKEVLKETFNKPYFTQLVEDIKQAYQQGTIYPAAKHIFRAFELSPFTQTKVVLLGQDPYHGVGQADGLAFSVAPGISLPPSLQHIFLELKTDLGVPLPTSGSLAVWAQQGVLLLNATLTVAAGKPGSHQKKGWETFTDAVIEAIALRKQHVVFMLWGSYAQKKVGFIDPAQHLVVKAAHPSPLAAYRGFFGHKPFSKANAYLVATGQQPIDW